MIVADLVIPEGLPVAGGWRSVGQTEPVVFPYDGTVIAHAPVGDIQTARRALDAAVECEDIAASMSSRLRHDLLMDARDRIRMHSGKLETLLVLETGKPRRDCRVEVQRALLTLELAAHEALRIHGETVPLDLLPSGDGMLGFYQRVPIGVVVGIAGFNYPFLLAMHKIAPAVAAGCPIVCKPAPQTPLSTIWLGAVMREAATEVGAPLELVQVVTGGVAVGETLTTDARIGAVSFTGSASVGHAIAKAAAPRKVLLELGSNAAMLVAADADLQAAASAVVRGGFYASGQACISVQRVIVEEPVYEELEALVREKALQIVVGDPRDEATEVSALIDSGATMRVQGWIEAAIGNGASAIVGGTSTELGPTILRNVSVADDLWKEEVFGPVVAMRSVPDFASALAEANRSRYGLHASVWTRSLANAMRAIRSLKVGGVVVNEVPGFRSDAMPYGGVKDSGNGREGPRFAIEELTVTKMAVIRS